ncbi:MAG: DUF4232 domain-containing protein, partial [Solirubrobacterales bacterium]|nr:DUF4232 domain-containing protein [Solirubrobacterales bacterium]
ATRTRPQQPPRPHHARPHRPKPAIKRRHAPVPAAKPKPKAAAFKAQTMTTVAITNPNATPAHSAKYNVHSRVCGAALIKAAAAPPNSAPGLTLLGFTLTNTSNSSCRTGGWPQLAFHGAGGKTVAVRVADSSSDMLGATPRRNLELNHGQQASFRISSASSDDSGGGGCPTVQSVSVTLPGDSGHLDVSLQNPEPVCPPAKVSALQPGSGGAGQ